jgi:hypothetical protein
MATEVATPTSALQAQGTPLSALPLPTGDSEVVNSALEFIFKEYDKDADGLMTRKEFFTFLWELKSDPAHKLNEGQMISCWNVVDANNHGSITLEEFRAGLDTCYEHYFYALENGAKIPESVMITHGIVESHAELENYNTVKFKKSMGVAFFEKVLEDEKRIKDEKDQEKKAKSTISSPFGERLPFKSRAERAAERAAEAAARGEPELSASPVTDSKRSSQTEGARVSSSATAGSPSASKTNSPVYATRFTARNSSAMAPLRPGSLPVSSYLDKGEAIPSGRPGFARTTLAKAQAEKEQKKIEAQRNMEKIMAERYQEERRRREEERLKREEERQAKLAAQNVQNVEEPEWKRNIRAGRK